MKNEALQRARGVRDFGPMEKISRDKIISSLKGVFEIFGYNPIETPMIERYELFASKFGIGQESDAMRETFKFQDQGMRDLVLRTEFTVPFARFVGMNPQLKLPFKRYQIGKVFRDGPIKLGRYREFYQCDVDVVGVAGANVDAELINLMNTAFRKLNLEVEIKINNRKILNAVLEYAGVPEDKQISTIISIDKLDKIGEEGVKAELAEKGLGAEIAEKALGALSIEGDNVTILEKLTQIIGDMDGLQDVKKAIELSEAGNLVFTPSLARGLAYYTGNVFEVFLKDTSKLSSSICAGGRFDDMVGGFIGTDEVFPAVGVSFGLDTIFDAIKLEGDEASQKQSVVDVYVVPVGEAFYAEANKAVKQLRKQDIPSDLDFLNRKIGKNFEYANSYGVSWVVVIGEEEVKQGKLTLKNMTSGNQELLSIEEIIQKIKA
jgi:histidyl-tRNA synthetase